MKSLYVKKAGGTDENHCLFRGGPRVISEGGGGGVRWYFDQITILTLRIRIDKRLIRFYTVTHPTILHTFTGIKMDLLKNFKYTIKGKRYEYLE